MQRVVLGVDRQQLRARLLAARVINSPAITSVSLFASATRLPLSSARKVGTKPTAPTVAETTQSASRMSRDFNQTLFADNDARQIDISFKQHRPQIVRGSSVFDGHELRQMRGNLIGQSFDVVPAASATTRMRAG